MVCGTQSTCFLSYTLVVQTEKCSILVKCRLFQNGSAPMIEIYGCRYVKSMPPKVFVYFWRAKLLFPMTSWPIRFYWVATQYNKWLEGIYKIAVNKLTYDGLPFLHPPWCRLPLRSKATTPRMIKFLIGILEIGWWWSLWNYDWNSNISANNRSTLPSHFQPDQGIYLLLLLITLVVIKSWSLWR